MTIATLTGDNGILTRAQEAKNKTEQAEDIEKIRLAVSEAQIGENGYQEPNQNNLQEAINNQFSGRDVVVSDNGDATFTVKVSDNNHYLVGIDGKVEFIKWYYDMNNNITDGSTILKIGDYVNYDATDNGNIKNAYTSPIGTDSTINTEGSKLAGNGYGNQTFNVNSAPNNWRILGLENGKILLLSEGLVKTQNDENFYLSGQTGYQYGIDELNNICSIFGNGKGAISARSINVEDVNRITEYNSNETEYCKGQMYEYGNEVLYTRSTETTIISNGENGVSGESECNAFIYYDTNNSIWKNLNVGDSIKLKCNYYQYSIDTTNEKCKMLIEDSSGNMLNYWLASSYLSTRMGTPFIGMFRIVNGALNAFAWS